MSDKHYDVIVLGVGGMGSATVFELARRGRRVLGLEQFNLVHDRGSSHGQTRIIRKAYYEHPAYVPLVQRAYQRWYDLEQLQGKRLLTECPCLSIGKTDSELIAGVQASAAQHHLSIENLSRAELRKRYPLFQVDEDAVGVVERDAGFLAVEECVRAHIEEARRLGADIHAEEPALDWTADAKHVSVQTARNTYTAERLVITAGPWAGEVLRKHGASLTVMRQVLLWFETTNDSLFRRDVFPIYISDTPLGYFYGFPVVDQRGHKVAEHYGAPELPHPDQVDRNLQPTDETPVRSFTSRYLPHANGTCREGKVCIYTLTPDRHFLIDRHPDHANVVLAGGFSGHGFKFASAVGEILADLADKGKSELPIEMFRFARFAVK